MNSRSLEIVNLCTFLLSPQANAWYDLLVCDECHVLAERYDQAARRLAGALLALRVSLGSPEFEAVDNEVRAVKADCDDARLALDRHRARKHLSVAPAHRSFGS